MVNQTPEQIARDAIDTKLEQVGWRIQNYREISLGQELGIAVREHLPTPARRITWVTAIANPSALSRRREQSILTSYEAQTARYVEQTEWLRMIKDHIASSCCIERDDFDYNPL